jgi:hypothetical protein
LDRGTAAQPQHVRGGVTSTTSWNVSGVARPSGVLYSAAYPTHVGLASALRYCRRAPPAPVPGLLDSVPVRPRTAASSRQPTEIRATRVVDGCRDSEWRFHRRITNNEYSHCARAAADAVGPNDQPGVNNVPVLYGIMAVRGVNNLAVQTLAGTLGCRRDQDKRRGWTSGDGGKRNDATDVAKATFA